MARSRKPQKSKFQREKTIYVEAETGEVIADPSCFYKTVINVEETYQRTPDGYIERQTIKIIKTHGKHEKQLELFRS